MSSMGEWYRSRDQAPEVRPTVRRAIRNWLRERLPEPEVEGKTIVLYSRRTFPTPSWRGMRSEFHGMFSEFQSAVTTWRSPRAKAVAVWIER